MNRPQEPTHFAWDEGWEGGWEGGWDGADRRKSLALTDLAWEDVMLGMVSRVRTTKDSSKAVRY